MHQRAERVDEVRHLRYATACPLPLPLSRSNDSERWWSRILGKAVLGQQVPASTGRKAVELVRGWCEPAPVA